MANVDIKETGVYTPREVQQILKISQSTFLRLVKRGVLSAAKIGGQYRVLGKELLRLVSPKIVYEGAERGLKGKSHE